MKNDHDAEMRLAAARWFILLDVLQLPKDTTMRDVYVALNLAPQPPAKTPDYWTEINAIVEAKL